MHRHSSRMCQPRPTPTLFPYTTLFRSHMRCPGRTGCQILMAPCSADSEVSCTTSSRSCDNQRPPATPATALRCGRSDRKSTRLNSSHVEISYAVFCLKKKTTDHQQS